MKKLILSFVSAGAVLAFAHAYAETIIEDQFETGSSTFSGRTPDTTDLPGTTYQTPANGYGTASVVLGGSSPGYGYAYGDDNVMISLSSGSYTAPAGELEISAGLSDNGTQYDDPTYRGVGLGFFSGLGSDHGTSDFDGLQLNPNGDLRLYIDGNRTNVFSTYDGTFDVTATHYLSYDYDSTTGDITDVILDGQDYSSYFAGASVTTGDDLAGFNVSSSNGGSVGYIATYLTVASPSIPEPGTDALFALGGCLALAGWLRLRRSKA